MNKLNLLIAIVFMVYRQLLNFYDAMTIIYYRLRFYVCSQRWTKQDN